MIEPASRTQTRTNIVEAAAELLHEQGPAALTTRGVALRAGVQAPTIYRLFGDKDGLLEAVAEHVMESYVTAKAAVVEAAAQDGVDPMQDLRDGWHSQIEFGLGNPTLFRLLSDPDRVRGSAAAESGRRVLEARVHRLAESSRLRVSEQRAVGLIHAAGIGAIQTLLAMPPASRDIGLADEIFEAILRQMVTDAPEPAERGSKAAAVAFRAVAPRLDMLTGGERQVLGEWVDRAIEAL